MAEVDAEPRAVDRHLIVGAGFCGLGIAAAFRRAGIPYDQLDASDDIGGNWYHGVYEGVHIISSRRTTQYADHPMPETWPDFPSAGQMLSYLRDYADHHELRPKIELSTRVLSAAPGPDGRWRVELHGPAGPESRVYRGIIAANGHHWKRRWPEYPGVFDGEVLHSKDYENADQLRDKRVLVVGGGNSACDIAVEAARAGAAAHISMRRGYWFMPKTILGVPTVEFIRPWIPVSVQRRIVRAAVRISLGRYEDYGLEHPDHRVFDRHPTINSELLYLIRHGRIRPHRDIARLDGRTVHFTDGATIEVDLIVFATGYHCALPFLSTEIVPFVDEVPQLVGGMLSAEHANLYVFGFGQPRYGAGPLISAGSEMLVEMIRAQAQLDEPLGAVLARMGARPPRSNIQDPMKVLRSAKLGRRIIPLIPRLRPFLRGRSHPAAKRPARPA